MRTSSNLARHIVEVIEEDTVSSETESIKAPESVFQEREGDENCVRVSIGSSLEEAERLMIERTLAYVRNNKSKAARILGLSRKTIHNKVRKYGLV